MFLFLVFFFRANILLCFIDIFNLVILHSIWSNFVQSQKNVIKWFSQTVDFITPSWFLEGLRSFGSGVVIHYGNLLHLGYLTCMIWWFWLLRMRSQLINGVSSKFGSFVFNTCICNGCQHYLVIFLFKHVRSSLTTHIFLGWSSLLTFECPCRSSRYSPL